MKKITLIAFLVISFSVYSQQKYTFKSGGRVYDINNEKVTPLYLTTTYSDNTDFLKLYKAGRFKKTIGNIMIVTGLSTIAIKHISLVNKSKITSNGSITPTNNILYFVGAGLVITAIPIKIGFSKKIRKSLEILNSSILDKKVTYLDSSILLNSNGIGLSLKF